MIKMSCRFLGLLGAVLFLCSLAVGDTLYSIGPDVAGIGRIFSAVPGGSPAFSLGDGSLSFNGGLASVGGDLFYTIANDSTGASTLHSFTLGGSGTLSYIASLGVGFNGGLAFNTANGSLYAVSNDYLGNSTLNRIDLAGSVTSLGTIGIGFYGGLTFNPFTDLLYGFQGDFTGAQRLFNSITPGPTPTVTPLFTLGNGEISFNGGVAFNPADGLYYSISNDLFANSTLTSFTLAGETSVNAVAPNFGFGYVNVGLAAPVPEPATLTYLLTAACLALGLRMARRRREADRVKR